MICIDFTIQQRAGREDDRVAHPSHDVLALSILEVLLSADLFAITSTAFCAEIGRNMAIRFLVALSCLVLFARYLRKCFGEA